MNLFQRKCIESSKRILERKGLTSLKFHENIGKNEKYYTLGLKVEEDRYTFYIYEDEAGFFLNKKWFICESPDFDSPEELIRAFCQLVEEKLPDVKNSQFKKSARRSR